MGHQALYFAGEKSHAKTRPDPKPFGIAFPSTQLIEIYFFRAEGAFTSD
jgi:hypothetical protein